MKQISLPLLLEQVEFAQQVETKISQYIADAAGYLKVTNNSHCIARDAEENRTHLDRLHGLTEVIRRNIAANLSQPEANTSEDNCTQLWIRIRFKHSSTTYQSLTKYAELMGREDIINALLESHLLKMPTLPVLATL